MNHDTALLRRFADDHSESAFRQLVDQHLGLVYRTALRRTQGNVHLAEEATQAVFCDLARKANQLADHPNLVGWLHTSTRYATSTLTRAMSRRHHHEQPIDRSHEPTVEASTPDEISAVIDDALEALPTPDREAILLRFFEDQPFAVIGAQLQISEDAARMRTHRATEKLRGILGSRGITSTATALSAVLAAQCAPVPAALSSQLIASRSLSALTTTAITATATGAIAWLSSASLAWTVAGIAAVAALTLAVREPTLSTTSETADAPASLTSQDFEAAAAPAVSERADPATPPEPVITQATVQERYNRAKRLARSGQSQAALEDFSWCFEIGMARVAYFSGVRLSFLVSDIATLAERFPAAREYLELRRLNALATFEDPLSGDMAAAELAAINNALGRNEETMEILLTLPVDDSRRQQMGHRGVKELLRDRQRYTDAATLITPSGMLAYFEAQARLAPLLDKIPASAIATRRQHFIKTVAKDVEVLAGAGRIAESRQAIEMLYTYDHSPGTVELLGQHLERAGATDLLAEIPLPQP